MVAGDRPRRRKNASCEICTDNLYRETPVKRIAVRGDPLEMPAVLALAHDLSRTRRVRRIREAPADGESKGNDLDAFL